MEITFLGTGSAYPSPHRGASCMVFRNDGTYWLFDCGEGSQIQLMKSQIRPGRISKVFITHLHGDHLFGLPGLMCTVGTRSTVEAPLLEIYGPQGLRHYLRTSLAHSRSELGYKYVVHELVPEKEQYPEDWELWQCAVSPPGGSSELHPCEEDHGRSIVSDDKHTWHLFEEDRLTVRASWLSHKIPCFGFSIDEAAKTGRLDVDLLKQKGVSAGPLYAQLKRGESISAPSGELPADVLGASVPGRRVVILGDTCDSRHMVPLCIEADVIVHEATLDDAREENAREKGHSTPRMAGEFGRQCRAKHLVLTHFSQRYQPLAELEQADQSVALLLEQGKAAFGENVSVADDFFVFKVALRNSVS